MSDIAHTVQKHLEIMRALRTPTGLFLASGKGVATGYDKAWLRDNFYTSLAFECAEDWDTVRGIWRAILDVLLKHESKIEWAGKQKPHASWQYIHARYHPETFEEFWDEWGNKQNDAVGAILFALGGLEEKGKGVIRTEDDRRIVQRLVDYLNSIEYWHDPDSGMWEEREEIHASSVGAAVAGIKKASSLSFLSIPQDLVQKGEAALKEILPRESASKFSDLALLSLFYPYGIVPPETADEILKNVEYHLARKNGIIRYKTDRYYNKNKDGWSEEAEWTFGFPWLAIIYKRRGNLEKARHYLEKAKSTRSVDEKIPELYFSNSDAHNENVPLGWAESLFVVACVEIEGSAG